MLQWRWFKDLENICGGSDRERIAKNAIEIIVLYSKYTAFVLMDLLPITDFIIRDESTVRRISIWLMQVW